MQNVKKKLNSYSNLALQIPGNDMQVALIVKTLCRRCKNIEGLLSFSINVVLYASTV